MSRHRNIQNLTDDDYYDYDDDYYEEDYDDDDYGYDNGYTKEENEAYYREQERLQKEKEKEEAAKIAAKKKKNAPQQPITIQSKSKSASASKGAKGTKAVSFSNAKKEALFLKPQASSPSSLLMPQSKESNEKERLVTSMGFSSEKAKLALERNSWDVQMAINALLTSPDDYEVSTDVNVNVNTNANVVSVSSKSTMAPPPGLTKPKAPKILEQKKASTETKGGGGVMAPPPGWGRPDAAKTTSASASASSKRDSGSNSIKTEKISLSSDNATKNSNSTSKPLVAAAKSNMNVNIKPKKKLSKELQQSIKQQRSRLSMVILGHVDAGKSTLMGQVLVQVGVVQKRIVNKYQKQAAQIGKASFALAWVMDEDESERERGVTIDIATKHISTNAHDLTILDAPGHADYVPAMITGAASADVGILVVAATPGEFESGFDNTTGSGGVKGHVGQTREHITLARGLGVSQLIVAVNKLDAAEPSWSQPRFIEIKRRLVPFLKSNGFDMKRVQFVPTSGISGVNIKTPPSLQDSGSTGLASWYNDQTLLQAIDKFEPAKRNIDKPFRFLAADIYSEGKFVIVKGRVVQGVISAGDKVVVLPIGDVAEVGRIEHGVAISGELSGERMNIAMAGDSVELYLIGIDVARISVGNIISDVEESFRPKLKRKMRARIMVMDRLTVPIIRGSQVLLHMHSLDVPAVISNLISQTNKDNNLNNRPRVLTGGANATVEIKLSEKICIEPFSECRALGRFALRRGGDTVAVGIVESTN